MATPAPQTPVGADPCLLDWLALTHAPGVGPKTISRLIERYGGPLAARRAGAEGLAALGLSAAAITALQEPDQDWIESVLAWAAQPNAHILTPQDQRYPPLLSQIAGAPVLLFVRGDPLLLAEPQIAIVGSRNPTPGGRDLTRELARDLAARGLVVTSGLAAGADAAAHLGALETGRTIAVLGTGPDLVYPAAHRELARRIADQGALVSEYAPGVAPLAHNFPRRNRIISGLTLATLVTEATLKSGSLITARDAMEQGRDVLAVPGSVRNPLARGCHALIRDGARLVEDADQVLAELAPMLQGLIAAASVERHTGTEEGAASTDGLDDDYQRLLARMGFDPVAPDELIADLRLPAESLSSMLLVLELQGHVSSCPGGRYCRVR